MSYSKNLNNFWVPIQSAYKALRPLLGGRACRFYPSCSSYAFSVCQSEGFLKGFYLSLRRILRCHPFHPGGVDLPPKHSLNGVT